MVRLHVPDDDELIHPYVEPRIGVGGWLTLCFVTVVFAVLIRTYLFQSFKIPSVSMEPTLLVGDHIFVDKFSFRFSIPGISGGPGWKHAEPHRGDIVVFYREHEMSSKGEVIERHYVKRVIGTPGDRIDIRGTRALVNGEDLDANYPVVHVTDNAFADPPMKRYDPVELGPNEFYVMGDNRVNSQDSRSFGPIYRSEIEGRVVIIYWSWGLSCKPFGICWSRIGHKVK